MTAALVLVDCAGGATAHQDPAVSRRVPTGATTRPDRMSISVHNQQFGMWTQLEAPTPERPYWREADDGTRHHLHDLLTGLDDHQAQPIMRLHAQAVGEITAAACLAWRAGHTRRARALARAAARLAEEIVGFWPVDPTQPTEDLCPPPT